MGGFDGTIYFGTAIDDKGLKPQLGNMKKSLSASFASMRDVMMGPVAAGKMVVGAIQQVGRALDGLVMQAVEAERSQAILSSTLKATGAEAWTSRTELNKYAETMSDITLFEDEAITSMQGVLLGFKNIKGDNFKSASTEILNMATVMKMDLTSAAQAVGKALDDPIAGIDSLSRQGFKFSKDQKTMLKALVETGDIAKAQKIILDELSTTYGGAAAAAADTATGSYQNLKKALGELTEELGLAIANSANWKKLGGFIKGVASSLGGERQAKETIDVFNKIAELQGTRGFMEMSTERQNKELAKFEISAQDASDAIENLKNKKKEWDTVGGIALAAATGKNIPDMKKQIDAQIASLEKNKKLAEHIEGIKKKSADDSEKDRKAEEKRLADEKSASELAAKNAQLESDYIDEMSRQRKENIDWSNEQVIKYAEKQKAIDKQIAKDKEALIEETSELEKQAAQEAADALAAAMAQAEAGFSAIASGISSIGGEEAQGLSHAFGILSGVINAASQGFKNVATDIEVAVSLISLAGENLPDFLGGVLDQLFGLTDGVMAALNPIFQAVLMTLGAIMPIFDPVVALIGELAKLIAPFIPLIAAVMQLYFDLSGLSLILQGMIIVVQAVANIFLWLYNNVVRPVYNFLVLVLNKIFNAFATFINSLLAAVDAIPLVELPYRISLRAETEGQLGEIVTNSPAVTEYTKDLQKANDSLKKNRDLFLLASKAADAYDAILSNLTDTVSSFYDGLKDIGSDIAGMIIDSINAGFDNDDFLYALEQYITEAVIQAAVFTDSFTAQVAQLGAQLAQAIARGDMSAIDELKDQLSALANAAAITAQAATDAVSGAFGSYAVGSMGLPSDGLIYAHAGEAVIPAGMMSEAARAGLTIAPTSSILSGLGNITINLQSLLEVDGLQMARVAFKYQDEVTGSAYGT